MITFLSGGTGTPKLVRGARRHIPDHQISVIVNTAEDLWISGNHLSPDIDTLLYLFSGKLNTDTWWGIRGDSFHTHEEVKRLGIDEYIGIGDSDRALHIVRGELLRQGYSLTEATRILSSRMGIDASILPMTDEEVATLIRTGEGTIHFQEYWVKHRGTLPIQEVIRYAPTGPFASAEVINAIGRADLVIIGPSNPITSILPILECSGVVPALMDAFVIAVSPFIGDAPVSGPAAALMKARGLSPDSASTCSLYRDFCDLFVQDIRDPVPVPGSLRYDTLMIDPEKSAALAGALIEAGKKGKAGNTACS
ncbi:MAG: 2-phospho-L-lactate transferase [Methanoregulaceae archaeon]|jgi:LPPG:FO 2-phospho-L-lactate transferase|nr:2-phospho-L-lactate transferase [Methanoregulaceae archaeon]MCU0628994.1 2-phospho-L-lactate transferase [Methanoregulaceae archaeon]